MNIRNKLLLFEAKRWVGVTERGGNNKGDIVALFQDAIGPKGQKVAWCASFVQYCVQMVNGLSDYMDFIGEKGILPITENTQELFYKSTDKRKMTLPSEGCIVVWTKEGDRGHGHCGIVDKITFEGFNMKMTTIEGNTSKNGIDGVYVKSREKDFPGYKYLGCINPFA